MSIFFAGYYCTRGVDRKRPGNGTTSYLNPSDPDNNCTCCGGSNTGVGGICPKGSYCVRRSVTPSPCLAGSYSDTQGAAFCLPCPTGYYCLSGAIGFDFSPCPSGHFCPENTTYAIEYPCPAGTYNPFPNRISQDDCLRCPAGEFCEGEGLNQTSGNCSAGHYCVEGSATRTPIDSEQGSVCPPGFFCPEGILCCCRSNVKHNIYSRCFPLTA